MQVPEAPVIYVAALFSLLLGLFFDVRTRVVHRADLDDITQLRPDRLFRKHSKRAGSDILCFASYGGGLAHFVAKAVSGTPTQRADAASIGLILALVGILYYILHLEFGKRADVDHLRRVHRATAEDPQYIQKYQHFAYWQAAIMDILNPNIIVPQVPGVSAKTKKELIKDQFDAAGAELRAAHQSVLESDNIAKPDNKMTRWSYVRAIAAIIAIASVVIRHP